MLIERKVIVHFMAI